MAEFSLHNSSIKGHLLTGPESQLWALLEFGATVGHESCPLGAHRFVNSPVTLRLQALTGNYEQE